jgi:alkylation response protein AidB-like acyl-CoA dehydrogenase
MSGAEDRLEAVRMIRDSAGAIAPRGGDFRRVRNLRQTDPGFDRGVWREMCELGWPGLMVPEDDGGSGLGMTEFAALAEELGAGLVPEPLVASAMAARVLRGPALTALLDGSQIVIPAWQERANTLDAVGDTTVTGGVVNGRKMFVPMASGADAFLVSGKGGLALVPRDAAGVSVVIERTQDGGNYGTVSFDNAKGEPVAGDFTVGLEEAAIATSAYLLGVMDRAFDMTLEYMKTRKQFGRAIGSFQSLQHRAADLKIQVALTRASVQSAAAVLDSDAPPALRIAAVSRAKARAAEASMLVTRQCIQLHGGIGYTDEYDVGLFLRKAMVLVNLYGSAGLHRARYAATAPDQED